MPEHEKHLALCLIFGVDDAEGSPRHHHRLAELVTFGIFVLFAVVEHDRVDTSGIDMSAHGVGCAEREDVGRRVLDVDAYRHVEHLDVRRVHHHMHRRAVGLRGFEASLIVVRDVEVEPLDGLAHHGPRAENGQLVLHVLQTGVEHEARHNGLVLDGCAGVFVVDYDGNGRTVDRRLVAVIYSDGNHADHNRYRKNPPEVQGGEGHSLGVDCKRVVVCGFNHVFLVSHKIVCVEWLETFE